MAKGSFTPTITLQRNNVRCYVGAGMSPQGKGKKKKKKKETAIPGLRPLTYLRISVEITTLEMSCSLLLYSGYINY